MLPVNYAFARNLLHLYVFHSTGSPSRFSWQLELKEYHRYSQRHSISSLDTRLEHEYSFHLNLHTTRSPTHSDTYQRSYWYNWLSWCSIQTCTPHDHLHTVTHTRGRIDTIDSPDVPSKPAHHTVTYIQWHIPEVVLIQLTCLVRETCRELE